MTVWAILVFAVVLVCASIVSYAFGAHEGYKDGYEYGYEDGYEYWHLKTIDKLERKGDAKGDRC
jgi:hypothetical protein